MASCDSASFGFRPSIQSFRFVPNFSKNESFILIQWICYLTPNILWVLINGVSEKYRKWKMTVCCIIFFHEKDPQNFEGSSKTPTKFTLKTQDSYVVILRFSNLAQVADLSPAEYPEISSSRVSSCQLLYVIISNHLISSYNITWS